MSQDRKWEVVHTGLLCTVHPQMVRARLQHVLVGNPRIGAGRRPSDHARRHRQRGGAPLAGALVVVGFGEGAK